MGRKKKIEPLELWKEQGLKVEPLDYRKEQSERSAYCQRELEKVLGRKYWETSGDEVARRMAKAVSSGKISNDRLIDLSMNKETPENRRLW